MNTPGAVLRVHLFAGWEAAQTATLAAALIAVIGHFSAPQRHHGSSF